MKNLLEMLLSSQPSHLLIIIAVLIILVAIMVGAYAVVKSEHKSILKSVTDTHKRLLSFEAEKYLSLSQSKVNNEKSLREQIESVKKASIVVIEQMEREHKEEIEQAVNTTCKLLGNQLNECGIMFVQQLAIIDGKLHVNNNAADIFIPRIYESRAKRFNKLTDYFNGIPMQSICQNCHLPLADHDINKFNVPHCPSKKE